MAVTFTSLAPEIYKAMDVVSRELVGYIPSVSINASGVNRAAKGDSVKSMVTPQSTEVTTHTPAMTVPDASAVTVAQDSFSLSSITGGEYSITGEVDAKLNNSFGAETFRVNFFAQMMRRCINSIESAIGTAVKNGASRAVGTAGTTPFASDFKLVAQARQILVDNGCPQDMAWTLVLNSLAGTNLRNLATLQSAADAGSADLLRRGTLLDLQGVMIKESAGIASHTKGTATGFDANGGEPVGETTIVVDGSDAGTILAGDVVTWAGDTNKYIVKSATASGAAAGNIVINNPGLREALADTVEGTIGNSYVANAMFRRGAVELGVRPINYGSGDLAVDVMTVVDPVSGLPFEFRMYKGYGQYKIECKLLYGVKVWQPEHVALILG